MNEDKPRIDPNMSFDLCRLGCSIYDFIIHDNDEKVMISCKKLFSVGVLMIMERTIVQKERR